MKGEEQLAVVEALRSLSVFGASQEGAYREHFAAIGHVLGPDVPTRLSQWITEFAESKTPGLVILTGNAGTGKTAVAQAFCRAVDADLPDADGLRKVARQHWVIKDLSGIPTLTARTAALKQALGHASKGP